MTLLKADIDSYLKEALKRNISKNHQNAPKNLVDSIRYSLLGPGKRIRPRLTFATADMLELDRTAAISAAVAVEMIHCFTLIHDDLPCMDNDDFRRGRPSNHKQFGEAIALLAGDALVGMAFDSFLEIPQKSEIKSSHFIRALNRFVEAIGPRGVVGGQAAELMLTSKSTLEEMTQMHAQKTGSLFTASIMIPRELAGVDEQSSQGLSLELFARELGLSFQVADDFSDAEEKPDPSSILFYLNAKSARDNTIRRLDAAIKSLNSSWGHKAEVLVQIAGEVVQKLETSPEAPASG